MPNGRKPKVRPGQKQEPAPLLHSRRRGFWDQFKGGLDEAVVSGMNSTLDSRIGTRMLVLFAILLVASVAVVLVLMPQAEIVRVTRHANALTRTVLAQPRFQGVHAQAARPNGATLVISGHVASDADLQELKKRVRATHPPVPVTWKVAIGKLDAVKRP